MLATGRLLRLNHTAASAPTEAAISARRAASSNSRPTPSAGKAALKSRLKIAPDRRYCGRGILAVGCAGAKRPEQLGDLRALILLQIRKGCVARHSPAW